MTTVDEDYRHRAAELIHEASFIFGEIIKEKFGQVDDKVLSALLASFCYTYTHAHARDDQEQIGSITADVIHALQNAPCQKQNQSMFRGISLKYEE